MPEKPDSDNLLTAAGKTKIPLFYDGNGFTVRNAIAFYIALNLVVLLVIVAESVVGSVVGMF